MDWISYGLEGLTALFTGEAMAWNFAYRSRPKWQPYVVECGYGNPPCLLVKIVNVGNGAATDVHATATHSPETPYGYHGGKASTLLSPLAAACTRESR